MPLICGVDEAGRGCLAGPVVASAVILTETVDHSYLKDSKKLTEKQRETAYYHLFSQTPYIATALIHPQEIDQINILNATLKAMKEAILKLNKTPDLVRIDGNKAPQIESLNIETIIKGDQKHEEISAASIIAKVTRDKLMTSYHEKYPQYGFHIHKGYATPYHYDMIFEHGPCHEHRRSFNLTKQTTLFPSQ